MNEIKKEASKSNFTSCVSDLEIIDMRIRINYLLNTLTDHYVAQPISAPFICSDHLFSYLQMASPSHGL
jgi:hypothetical protein